MILEADGQEIEVTFFGRLVDGFGRATRIAIPAGGCSIGDVRRLLNLELSSVHAALNDVIATEDDWVRPGAAVEFFPPVSGG